jgi:hypothetical protein
MNSKFIKEKLKEAEYELDHLGGNCCDSYSNDRVDQVADDVYRLQKCLRELIEAFKELVGVKIGE